MGIIVLCKRGLVMEVRVFECCLCSQLMYDTNSYRNTTIRSRTNSPQLIRMTTHI